MHVARAVSLLNQRHRSQNNRTAKEMMGAQDCWTGNSTIGFETSHDILIARLIRWWWHDGLSGGSGSSTRDLFGRKAPRHPKSNTVLSPSTPSLSTRMDGDGALRSLQPYNTSLMSFPCGSSIVYLSCGNIRTEEALEAPHQISKP